MKDKLKFSTNVLWFFIVFSAIWGSNLPGINILGITLYPIRLIALIYVAWTLFSKCKTERFYIRVNSLNIVMSIFLVYSFLTLFWSTDFSTSMTALVVYVTNIALMYMTLQEIKSREMIACICNAFFLNGALLFVLAIYESITGDYFLQTEYLYLTRFKNVFGLFRPKTAFYNINNYSVFLSMLLPIAFIQQHTHFRFMKTILIYIISAVPIILTNSRTGMISLVIIMLFAMNNKVKKRVNNKAVWNVIIVITFILSLAFMASDIGNIIFSGESITDEDRWSIWVNIIQNSMDCAFLGAGIGCAESVNTLNGMPPHNYFLELLAETGIVGVAMLVFLLVKMIPSRKAGKNQYSEWCMLFVVVFIVNSICPSSMQGYYWMWIMWGIVIRCNELESLVNVPVQPQHRCFG